MYKRDKKGRFFNGMKPWNRGIKTGLRPRLGKKHTEATKQKIKETHKKISHSYIKTKFKKNMIPWNKDIPMSRKTKQKLSLSKTKEAEFTGFKNRLNRRIRKLKYYEDWRKSVFIRDNWTCQNCKKKGHLEVHHIIPLFQIIKEEKIKDISDLSKSSKILDICNGITYCLECHQILDKYRRLLNSPGGQNYS